MTIFGLVQICLYLTVLLFLIKPLGAYMAHIYQGEHVFLDPVLRPLERFIYRIARVNHAEEMDWKTYAMAMLAFNATGLLFLYLLLRLQNILPLNLQGLPAVPPDLAFNTAVSFVTNTNWQSYAGEVTMSYLSQMVGLAVQNFLSAATGMAVLVAMVRGFVRHSANTIGNYWVDITRSVIYILAPLSVVLALALVSQGVVQTFNVHANVSMLQPVQGNSVQPLAEQTLALGPAASQTAIKQLGTNGGGFFNVNSSHPFENPTPFSNFLEMLSILLIPAALCYTFGRMVGDTRKGWAILAAMTIVFVAVLAIVVIAEQGGNPAMSAMGIDQTATDTQPGGNMEGKEARFGIVNSALWATATTAASNGSVNSMLDSFTPLGGLFTMWLMQLGEVVYGGVGSGLYGMLTFVIIAVFIAGLMIGRTPEYLGKKVEVYEIKMASLVVLIPILTVLLGTAVAVSITAGKAAVFNPGAHGFSEILYAFSSAGNNNGSAFAGLGANTGFYNSALAVAMLFARYCTAIPVLAIAGALASKKIVPAGPGTLPTHGPLFIIWLIVIVIIVGALSFFPALALGPIAEYLMMR